MKKPLIIWGASGHAKVLVDFMLHHELVALFDNSPEIQTFANHPVHHGRMGFLSWKEQNNFPSVEGVVAIGGDKGFIRLQIQEDLRNNGIKIVTTIHPGAIVANDCSLGEGCQILAGSVVGVDVRLGKSCILNTNSSVDHECSIGDGSHIAPGATLAGCVEVGSFSMIAVGAIVMPRIRIGSNVVVGAGSIVTRDIPDNAVVMGQPARVIRWRPCI